MPDDLHALEAALRNAPSAHDLILISGSISVGSEDHLATVIRRCGTLDLWRIAIKPGKPVGLGDIGACPPLALAGNPIAALVAFVADGRTVALRLAGAESDTLQPIRLPAAFAFAKKVARQEYLAGWAMDAADGGTSARIQPRQGAAMLLSVAESQDFVVSDDDAIDV